MSNLPESLEEILAASCDPDTVFSALLPVLVNVLQCDRCFLYLRNPKNNTGKTAYCWCRSPEYPDLSHSDLRVEPESLSKEDPLFAAALRTKPTIFVEDVETADSRVVNLAFEQKNFGHRALIHAHLCQDGELWGILQPCVFGHPRVWSQRDRSIIAQVEQRITPLAVAYVKKAISC